MHARCRQISAWTPLAWRRRFALVTQFVNRNRRARQARNLTLSGSGTAVALALALLSLLLAAAMGIAVAGIPAQQGGLFQESPIVVPVPDISGTEEEVQKMLLSARRDLDEMLRAAVSSERDLALAFGEMGELYHSHHIYVPADPCYRIAARLAPEEFRWPYYLGYLMVQTSQPQRAVVAFQRALEIRPDYAPAKLRLAGVHLDLGQLVEAEILYQATRTVEGLRAAALFGLGRLAMARREPQRALPLLEEALRLQPAANKIHYSLAMAHRALGNIALARKHLAQHGEGKPEIADPMLEKLDAMATGVRPLFFHAIDAVHVGHHEKAVELFQQALAKEPDNDNARVSLARSLYLTGQFEEARRQLEEVLRQAPHHVLGNFFLGVWLHAAGEQRAAVKYFETSLEADPQHSGAHHFLANTYMANRDYPRAMRHYEKVVEKVPENLPARLMLAMAMVGAGRPHVEVRDSLARSREAFPNQSLFGAPLARLLAASPDPGVRNGTRALALAEALFQAENRLEHAETLAMAYAETGRYRDAARLQENAFNAALAARRLGWLARLNANLALYRVDKPCRQPFADNDPLFYPQPMDPAMVFREYPTTEAY